MSRSVTTRRGVRATLASLFALVLLGSFLASPAAADDAPPAAGAGSVEGAAPADDATAAPAPTADEDPAVEEAPAAEEAPTAEAAPAPEAPAEETAPQADLTPAPEAPAADPAPAEQVAATPQAAPVAAAAPAAEAPGNRGTVKIHRSTTADDDRRNEPKVCSFRIVGFGFPADANLEVSIVGHGGPNAGPDTYSDTIPASELSADGDFAQAGPTLANGMYKLSVENTTAPGGAKQKVFKVQCPEGTEGVSSLEVAKVVDGDDPEPPTGSFTFDVDCGEAFSGPLDIGDGESDVVSDLPVGTTCTITEVDDLGADATTIEVTPSEAGQAPEGSSVTVTTGAEGTTVTVTFTNTFNAPAVVPEVITPEAPPAPAVAPTAAVSPATLSQLPRTGGEIAEPLTAGLVLIGLGAGCEALARRRRAAA